jgi:minor extracellular serine protease Vpr
MHRGSLRLLALIAATMLVSVFPLGVLGQDGAVQPLNPAPSAETGMMTDESTNLWFVELTGRPTADGNTAAAVRQEQNQFRNAARGAGLRYQERFAFQTLWNGFSIQMDASQLTKLTRINGVKAVYPVVTMSFDPGVEISPELATALAMTGADVAQSELGYTGAGIRVAVMDTGVDYHHPDLGGCFGPGCRVVAGWDFVGDAFNADSTSPAYNPNPVPDPDPDDCNGHGTHVAGIIGANGEVKGVAPAVTFGAYKVFGCAGGRHACAQHEHRLGLHLATVPDCPGQRPAGQQGHGRRRLDRQ